MRYIHSLLPFLSKPMIFGQSIHQSFILGHNILFTIYKFIAIFSLRKRNFMSSILIEKREKGIVVLTIDSPGKQNAFNASMLEELQTTLERLKKNKDIKILYITGSGDKSFSAGVFLKDLVEFADPAEARVYAELLESTMDRLFNFPKPVIALINGYALGGGFGIAMSSDIRIMTENAVIGFPAVRIGAILPAGCTYRLLELAGAGKAKELLLTGRHVKSDEALNMGLVNYVVKDRESLFAKADEISEQILQASGHALAMTKATVNQHTNELIYRYSLYSSDNFAYLFTTKDWKERIDSFLKRKN